MKEKIKGEVEYDLLKNNFNQEQEEKLYNFLYPRMNSTDEPSKVVLKFKGIEVLKGKEFSFQIFPNHPRYTDFTKYQVDQDVDIIVFPSGFDDINIWPVGYFELLVSEIKEHKKTS
jgi:hypothetical protein